MASLPPGLFNPFITREIRTQKTDRQGVKFLNGSRLHVTNVTIASVRKASVTENHKR
jgi:hypothetical protein